MTNASSSLPRSWNCSALMTLAERGLLREQRRDRNHEGQRRQHLAADEQDPVDRREPVRLERHHPVDRRRTSSSARRAAARRGSGTRGGAPAPGSASRPAPPTSGSGTRSISRPDGEVDRRADEEERHVQIELLVLQDRIVRDHARAAPTRTDDVRPNSSGTNSSDRAAAAYASPTRESGGCTAPHARR